LSDAQLGQVATDRVEGGGHLVRRGQQLEFVRAAQFCSKVDGSPPVFTWIVCRSTLAAFDVRAGYRLRSSGIGLRAAPAILRVQAVGQQNDYVGVLVQWVLGCIERRIARRDRIRRIGSGIRSAQTAQIGGCAKQS
jgi:hypothetical protein